MQPIEIIVIVIASLIVLGVTIKVIVDKKNGKCSYNCEDCPSSCHCEKRNKK